MGSVACQVQAGCFSFLVHDYFHWNRVVRFIQPHGHGVFRFVCTEPNNFPGGKLAGRDIAGVGLRYWMRILAPYFSMFVATWSVFRNRKTHDIPTLRPPNSLTCQYLVRYCGPKLVITTRLALNQNLHPCLAAGLQYHESAKTARVRQIPLTQRSRD